MPNPNILRKIVFPGAGILFDPDAQIYFDAIVANSGATSDIEKGGYNIYRLDSKSNSYNADCHIDLPMIGGTVESMVVNAQQPGTFDQVAVNTVSGDFTANGFEPNGINSYFRMGLIASATLTIQSVALEFYSRTNADGALIDMGALITTGQTIRVFIKLGGDFYCDMYNIITGQGRIVETIADSLGGHTVVRLASNDQKIYTNGTQLGSTNTGSGGTQPTIEFYLGANNNAGSPANFSTRQCAGAGIYDGLTTAKVLSQYLARQVLNTTLSRNV